MTLTSASISVGQPKRTGSWKCSARADTMGDVPEPTKEAL